MTTLQQEDDFEFQFSLQILNHLGRGLYRSFATVIAEAVSNAWDADAREVDIRITSNSLVVEDDGKGMNATDFQRKFLNVGYSRRDDPSNKSQRNVIGRKGIGKLAMLSISKKVTLLSRTKKGVVVGGRVNNARLDSEIKKDGKYTLERLSESEKRSFTKVSGTKIVFEDIVIKLNSVDIIRKYLATQFNFIFSLSSSDSFTIKVNGSAVSVDDLKDLNNSTQFLWRIGDGDISFDDRFPNLKNEGKISNTSFEFEGRTIDIKGFVASVQHVRQILLRGSGGDFKASVNLFTNGRLRQENVFEEVAKKTVAEEYLYGELHVDSFEDEKVDRFTSSREGIIKDDPLYQAFLVELEKILSQIIKDWTPWRRAIRQEGDIDEDNRPGYVVRMEDSQNRREKDYRDRIESALHDKETKKKLKETLRNLSYKNSLVYQDLFILENIFREYIKLKGINEEDLDENTEEEKEIKRCIKETRDSRVADEERHSLRGKIVKSDHYLNNLYLFHLGEIIDRKINKVQEKKKRFRKGLDNDTHEIGPIRNTVMHTVEVTDDVMNWNKIKNVIDYIDRLESKLKKDVTT